MEIQVSLIYPSINYILRLIQRLVCATYLANKPGAKTLKTAAKFHL